MDIVIITYKGADIVINFIILSIAFISAWLSTSQIFRIYSDHNCNVKMANTFNFNIIVYEYIKHKSFGEVIGYMNDSKYEFIDDDFYFFDIINRNRGNYVDISCISKVEGIILFTTQFHLYDVKEKSYKHFDKFN
jgi:hypothetical protein